MIEFTKSIVSASLAMLIVIIWCAGLSTAIQYSFTKDRNLKKIIKQHFQDMTDIKLLIPLSYLSISAGILLFLSNKY